MFKAVLRRFDPKKRPKNISIGYINKINNTKSILILKHPKQ